MTGGKSSSSFELPRFRVRLGSTLALAVAVLLLALVAMELSRRSGNIVTIWLANALVLAVLLGNPVASWPRWIAAGLAGNLAANLVEGYPAGLALALGLCNSIEVILAGGLLRRWGSDRGAVDLSRPAALIAFIAAGGLVAPATSALLASTALRAASEIPLWITFRSWFLADSLGLLSVVPLLAGTRREELDTVRRGSRLPEALVLLALVPATTAAVVLRHDMDWLLLLCPIVLGAAFRLGFFGATFAIALAAASGTVAIAFDTGHPPGSPFSLLDQVELFQLFLLSATLSALPAAALHRAVTASERALNEAQAVGRIGSYSYDVALDRVTTSSVLDEILGASKGTKGGLEEWLELVHPSMRREARADFRGLVAGPGKIDRDYRVIRAADGEERWIHCLGIVEGDPGGSSRRLVGTVQDITDRRRAEGANRTLLERLELAARAAHLGIWDWDIERNELVWDDRTYELHGVTRESFGGDFEAWLACIHPDDRARRREEKRRILESGTGYDTEYRVVWPDGAVRNLKFFAVIVRDEAGRPLRETGVILDVTDRRRAERTLRESEAALREAQSIARVGSFAYEIGPDRWNGTAVLDEIFGIEGGCDGTFAGWLRVVHPSMREEMEIYFRRFVLEQGRFDREYRIVRVRDGVERWVHGLGILELGPDGAPRRLVGTIQDVTERKSDEERLRLASTVFSSSREGFVLTDRDANVQGVNAAFTEITGYGEAEIVGQNMRLLRSGRHEQPFYRDLWHNLLWSGYWQGEIWNRRRDGTLFPEWLSISAVRDESGLVTGFVGVFTDISRLKSTEERLEHVAHHDALTNLPNRTLLSSHLGHAVARNRRKGGTGAVLSLDLDRFKRVNDSLGHAAGEELLAQAAGRLRGRVRESDTIARVGGDEFVVVVEELAAAESAAVVAQDLIEAFHRPFVLEGHGEACVGLSVGISIFPSDGERPELLVQNADAALHSAKARGGDTFCFYSEALTEAARERLALESALRRGLLRNEFLLHYQPLVSLEDGHVEGVEALVRWKGEGGILVLPAGFIQVAEETRLIVPLGEQVEVLPILRPEKAGV